MSSVWVELLDGRARHFPLRLRKTLTGRKGALRTHLSNRRKTAGTDGSDERPKCPARGARSVASGGIRTGIGSNLRGSARIFHPLCSAQVYVHPYTTSSELNSLALESAGSEAEVAGSVISEGAGVADVGA